MESPIPGAGMPGNSSITEHPPSICSAGSGAVPGAGPAEGPERGHGRARQERPEIAPISICRTGRPRQHSHDLLSAARRGPELARGCGGSAGPTRSITRAPRCIPGASWCTPGASPVHPRCIPGGPRSLPAAPPQPPQGTLVHLQCILAHPRSLPGASPGHPRGLSPVPQLRGMRGCSRPPPAGNGGWVRSICVDSPRPRSRCRPRALQLLHREPRAPQACPPRFIFHFLNFFATPSGEAGAFPGASGMLLPFRAAQSDWFPCEHSFFH